ncbi:MAG TPA: twin transmembrane helix small protein [Alphaproteobacteria bacterium]|nr:twin transmembrane helix small protein [Alphaproteobacteria bacterium]
MEPFLRFLVPVSISLVFLVLCAGIFAMFRGGEFNRTWSNRLMRLRVAMQFAAIIIIMGALFYTGS